MEGVAAIGLWGSLESADKAATLAINGIHGPASDWFWQTMSLKEIWFPLYIAVAIFLFIRLGWKRGLVVLLACILTIVACDQFANFTKDFFARLRPCNDEYMVLSGLHMLEAPNEYYKYGFYSAHAANAMGFAVSSSMGLRLDPRLRYRGYVWPVVVWGFLVGLSRIFVGKHFLGDVIVGLALGALFAWLFISLARLVIRRLGIN